MIAGVLLADALAELHLSMPDFALMVERHPDNVAAALMMTRKPGRKCLLTLPDAIEDWGKEPPRHWTLRALRMGGKYQGCGDRPKV